MLHFTFFKEKGSNKKKSIQTRAFYFDFGISLIPTRNLTILQLYSIKHVHIYINNGNIDKIYCLAFVQSYILYCICCACYIMVQWQHVRVHIIIYTMSSECAAIYAKKVSQNVLGLL